MQRVITFKTRFVYLEAASKECKLAPPRRSSLGTLLAFGGAVAIFLFASFAVPSARLAAFSDARAQPVPSRDAALLAALRREQLAIQARYAVDLAQHAFIAPRLSRQLADRFSACYHGDSACTIGLVGGSASTCVARSLSRGPRLHNGSNIACKQQQQQI